MRKKDILELKKRYKKDHATFTKMCGCYVNGEKNILLQFRETFLNLDEDEFFKYMEIAKKVLSGTIGNNILKLDFPLNEDLINEKQIALMQLKNSQLKDDSLLENFYKSIIENYEYTGNFLILLFHDAYDVITKTKDNIKVDESEEVYEYILCAICPVELTKPGLRYFEEDNTIKARVRDWVVDVPSQGFVFPAFIERSSDVNSIMYYTKNAKDPHPELMEGALGCPSKQTATIQKLTFQSIIKDTVSVDEEEAEKIFMEVQENLNAMVEDYNAVYDDTDDFEPITLTKKEFQNLLIESGVPEDVSEKIENEFVEHFGIDVPLAENLIDGKALLANAQKKREENLVKQVAILETKLEEAKKEAANKVEIPFQEEENSEEVKNLNSKEVKNLNSLESENEENVKIDEVAIDADTSQATTDNTTNYDIVLQVKPDKMPQIKSQIIDGQNCLIIPVNEDENTKVDSL